MDSQRNEEFVKALVEYQSDIYGFIATMLMLPRWHDAEDLFQQTSLILWQKWDQYDRSQDFLWACGIARNVVRNFLRCQAGRRIVFSEELVNELAEVRLDAQRLLEEQRGLLVKCIERLDFSAPALGPVLQRPQLDQGGRPAIPLDPQRRLSSPAAHPPGVVGVRMQHHPEAEDTP